MIASAFEERISTTEHMPMPKIGWPIEKCGKLIACGAFRVPASNLFSLKYDS
jgi:hypothetical protein